jgi:hypothetical protein
MVESFILRSCVGSESASIMIAKVIDNLTVRKAHVDSNGNTEQDGKS